MLSHKASLNNLKRLILSMFYDHGGIKLGIKKDNQKIQKFTVLKISNTILNNPGLKSK